MLAPFHYAFVQRGALELLLLAVGAGVLGTWIVLRGLAFYSHGVATAAFPGLVLAAGVGFAAPLGAFGAALVFAFGVERLAHRRRIGHDTLTALVLIGTLALGIVLASDVFHSQANVAALLFGSVLAVGSWDLAFAAIVSAVALVVAIVLARRWLAVGFDPGSARAIGVCSAITDALLLLTIALAVTSALAAVGTMLTSALYVLPAATTRLWISDLRTWQLASVALAAAEGVAGLWLAGGADLPPGPRRAGLCGATVALAAPRRGGGTRAGGRGRGPARGLRGSGRRARAGRGRHDDADRRLGSHRRRRLDHRAPAAAAEHRPARVRAAAARCRRDRAGGGRARERRRPRRLDEESRLARWRPPRRGRAR